MQQEGIIDSDGMMFHQNGGLCHKCGNFGIVEVYNRKNWLIGFSCVYCHKDYDKDEGF